MRLLSKYMTASGQVSNGRCRLHSAIFLNKKDSSSAEYFDFHDGTTSSGTPILCRVYPNTDDTGSADWYGPNSSLDIPSEGILFDTGIYLHSTMASGEGCVTLIFSGGAPA